MPIGGYKGYGLALIVGLLAGTLNGAAMGSDVIDFNHDDTSATNTGQAIMAIDLAAFGDVGAVQGRASTSWCATCAPASACRASSASGCPASRATASASPTSATASRLPAAAARSSTRSPQRDGHRAASQADLNSTRRTTRHHDNTAAAHLAAPACWPACARRGLARRAQPAYPEQADPHDRAAGRRQRGRQRRAHRGAEDVGRTWASRS